MGTQLWKTEITRQSGESSCAGAGAGWIGQGGEVTRGQLHLAKCDMAALSNQSAQPPHRRALVALRLLLEDQQANRKCVVQRDSRKLGRSRPDRSEIAPAKRSLEDRVRRPLRSH